ncbi:MAG: hypothetical protein KGL39_51650 [Patescibacteria group bacterium]|nr:hypothetical protein [Patescibacteria group bacterium]
MAAPEANRETYARNDALRQAHAICKGLEVLPYADGRLASIAKMERAAESLLQNLRVLRQEEAPAAMPDAGDFT